MHRVDTPSAAAALPAPETPGTPGYFTKGDPVGAIPATVPGPDFFNMLQEEMVRVVLDAGLTLDASKGNFAQLSQAIRILTGAVPLGAMDYPTIDTPDNRIGATGATATNGGTVSVPADVVLTLGEEETAGENGRTKTFKTVAFTSADLNVNETYYLRARVNAGALEIYTQIGTDLDSIPGTLTGTPGGLTGGGFDSTVLDALLAKVVTGGAGTSPTVTNLANNRVLQAASTLNVNPVRALVFALLANSGIALNWARSPVIAAPSLAFIKSTSGDPVGGLNGASINMTGVDLGSVSFDRYSVADVNYAHEDTNSGVSSGNLQLSWWVTT